MLTLMRGGCAWQLCQRAVQHHCSWLCLSWVTEEANDEDATDKGCRSLQSILAGRAWKEKYSQAAAAVAAHGQPWTFDQAAVFAHVDAFIQRCG